jgi:hypothetical protein
MLPLGQEPSEFGSEFSESMHSDGDVSGDVDEDLDETEEVHDDAIGIDDLPSQPLSLGRLRGSAPMPAAGPTGDSLSDATSPRQELQFDSLSQASSVRSSQSWEAPIAPEEWTGTVPVHAATAAASHGHGHGGGASSGVSSHATKYAARPEAGQDLSSSLASLAASFHVPFSFSSNSSDAASAVNSAAVGAASASPVVMPRAGRGGYAGTTSSSSGQGYEFSAAMMQSMRARASIDSMAASDVWSASDRDDHQHGADDSDSGSLDPDDRWEGSENSEDQDRFDTSASRRDLGETRMGMTDDVAAFVREHRRALEAQQRPRGLLESDRISESSRLSTEQSLTAAQPPRAQDSVVRSSVDSVHGFGSNIPSKTAHAVRTPPRPTLQSPASSVSPARAKTATVDSANQSQKLAAWIATHAPVSASPSSSSMSASAATFSPTRVIIDHRTGHEVQIKKASHAQ